MISRFSNWLKLVYLLFLTGVLFLSLSHRVYDDPFITFRYAENLRNGLGFVYNAGERVLSTTTPLYTVLLASISMIWPGHLPQLANLVGALSVAVGGFLLWDLAQTWKAPLVAWSVLLLYPTFPLLLSTLGSETPLFLAFVLGTFACYARRRYQWAVILVALAILTRSDGILVAALLGVHYLWQKRAELRKQTFWREQPWSFVGIAFGLLLFWHGFAWIYFGAPIPVTLAAKQAQGRMAISQHFAPGLLTVAGWYAGRWQYWVELLLALLGVGVAVAKKRQWLLVLAWTGLYMLAYSLLGVTRYFWYYAPLVPGWVITVGLGITFIFWLPIPVRSSDPLAGRRICLGLAVTFLTAIFLGQLSHFQKMINTNDARYPIYRAVGEWLEENTPADASVGALEVGMIGYFSKRPMVDFAGLISPKVADQMTMDSTYDDTAIWATQTYQPEYLALIVGAHPRLEAEIVAELCQPVKKFNGSEYNYHDMVVFACQYD